MSWFSKSEDYDISSSGDYDISSSYIGDKIDNDSSSSDDGSRTENERGHTNFQTSQNER
ncbi:MAG: hypothetical protein LBR47_05330 [Spirochaetaceae bacterium]|jgi:hypothetical protein|nr:hypothetical protein [Spirochaetaceae bacterium]